MDTITHGIVGALTGKALFSGRDLPAKSADGALTEAKSSSTARVAILGCTIGSIFPDIDIFAGPIAQNPLAIMEWHRNITHSLLVLPLWAALLTAISIPLARWLRCGSPPFFRLFGIYVVGLLTHVFLDVVTNFGTMVWSPLKYSRAAWDWLYILDLTLTALALVPQLAAWCYRKPERSTLRCVAIWAGLIAGAFGGYVLAASAGYGFPMGVVAIASAIFALILFLPARRGAGFTWSRASWCRVGLLLACAYLALAANMHARALTDVRKYAAVHQLPTENVAVLPLPPTFTHWVALIWTPEGVWRSTFHEPGGEIERTQIYLSAQSDPLVEKARTLRSVQTYLWFARFPIWRLKKQGGKTAVEISDVRFFREEDPDADPQNPRSMRFSGSRSNSVGFTFQVVFDEAGTVISSGFKKIEP